MQRRAPGVQLQTSNWQRDGMPPSLPHIESVSHKNPPDVQGPVQICSNGERQYEPGQSELDQQEPFEVSWAASTGTPASRAPPPPAAPPLPA
jgi:hypothetical protein